MRDFVAIPYNAQSALMRECCGKHLFTIHYSILFPKIDKEILVKSEK